MKQSVKLSLFGMALVILFVTQVCDVRAASVEDCLSQEGCVVILQNNSASVWRKGLLKGTITGVSGDSTVSANDGWIIMTDTSSSTIYLYELATGILCQTMSTTPCEEGLVYEDATDPLYSVVVMACPSSNERASFNLTCGPVGMTSTNGTTPRSITSYGDDKLLILNSADGVILGYNGPTGTTWTNHSSLTNAKKIRYWNNGSDPAKIFINAGDNIYWQETNPILDGIPPVFATVPAGKGAGSMAVSNTHVFVAAENSQGAYLFEIANPSSSTYCDVRTPFSPVKGSSNVALVSNAAVAIDNSGSVKWFAMDGTLLYEISESAYSIASLEPTEPPLCPNNLVEPGEVCDGTDFDGATCANHSSGAFDGGELSCSASCDQVFTSGCYSCGDGTLNPGESCDGTDMGTASCTAAGYDNGDVSCTASCTVDYSQCYTCGNSLIEGVEDCEGADLNGATCSSEGFIEGTISCGTDCFFDTSSCHMCGNSIADNGETCDGTDTPGNICQTLDLGYTGGELACTSTCDGLDDSGCYTCGDGNIDTTEECDGVNLDSNDCGTLGLGSGTLSCFENCTFNYSQCSVVPTEYCGNNTIDPGEECDDGNRSNSDDCSEFCKIIPPTCGLGGVDPGESCDGTDLDGASCTSLGYQAGVLYCGGDCQFRTDNCSFTSTPQTISLELDPEPDSEEFNEDLRAQYENLKATLTPNCVSQDVNGDLVLTTTQGSYCAVRATVLNKSVEEKVFSFIYMPEHALEDEPPVLRFYQNGTVARNLGAHLTAYKGLEIKTVLVQDRLYHVTQERIAAMGMKFLAVHPETGSRGRWLAVTIGTGSTSMCTDEQGDNCALLVPAQGQVILNMDALENVSEFDFKPPTDSGGCNCTTGSNSSNSFPLFLLLGMAFLFWKRRNCIK